MNFLFDAPMATILVGTNKKKFFVHQALLCSKSQYFTKALTGPFEESQTGIVILEDLSPVLFRMFVSWLYAGRIVYTISDGSSTIKQDFESLESMPPDRHHEESQMSADDTSTWSCEVLIGLYVLADRLDTKELRIQIIDALAMSLRRQRSRCLTATSYSYIHANTTSTSPLRKLAVDMLVYDIRHSLADQHFWMELLHDLAVTALLTSSQRVPQKLCNNCYQKGLTWNDITLDGSSPCKTRDLIPYKQDMCIYHEHADDEEKKACLARRNTFSIN